MHTYQLKYYIGYAQRSYSLLTNLFSIFRFPLPCFICLTYLKIKEKAKTVYPNIRIETYSPPYKPEFTEEENQMMIDAINAVKPDLLWIGMTAPKQEKWAYTHLDALEVNGHIGTIGAVFDFFAGTVERAPVRWQEHGLEWLYRLIKEPRRMWRRYIIGNTLFLWNITKEKFSI